MKRRFDPLGTEILKNALESLVDEMAMTVLRTARTPTTSRTAWTSPPRSASPPASWSPRA